MKHEFPQLTRPRNARSGKGYECGVEGRALGGRLLRLVGAAGGGGAGGDHVSVEEDGGTEGGSGCGCKT